MPTRQIPKSDCEWKDIGSGTFARTFPQAERLITTSRGRPPIGDIHRMTIWSLSLGRVIDDCVVDDVSDERLHRELGEADDLRVEFIMKGAAAMYNRSGADIAEIDSQPRIAQEAASYCKDGIDLKPGWSLDLTRCDPNTGQA